MRNLILAGIVSAALLGLAFVQYRLLRVGIQLEKERLDGQVMAALQNVSQRLDNHPELRGQLLRLQQNRFQPLAIPGQNLAEQVADSMNLLLKSALLEKGLQFPFTFAMTESYLSYTVLEGPSYTGERTASYRSFSYLLKGRLRRECGCDFFIHLLADDLFPALLKRLYNLLIPSLVFILLLLLGLALLMRTLNQQRRLSRVKNDFINNLAHELKTPAFSIGLLSRLLHQSIESGNTTKSKEYLNLLEGENKQIKIQFEKVLELASLESGRYQLDKKEVAIGPFLFDYTNQKLVFEGEERLLTEREAALLHLLCQKKGKLLSRREVLKALWNQNDYFTRRSMDVFISRLRKYLSADPAIEIQNVYGSGFILRDGPIP